MTGSRCAATTPGFLVIYVRFCAKSMKPLRRNVFPFDRLITPTLKVAGSNPVGRTTKRACRRMKNSAAGLPASKDIIFVENRGTFGT